MKKIIASVLFLPLLIVSICIAFVLFKSRNVTNTATNNTNQTLQSTTDLTSSVQTVLPTSQPAQVLDEINLIIVSPESGAIADTNSITLMGTTQPGASVAINDAEVTASKDGSFKSTINLDEGENYISIVAYNDAGNVAEREIMIMRTVSGL
jgi:hypothetical protein